MADTARTWLITGCSSGLGRSLAEVALARGERVAATARKPATVADLAAQYPAACRALALDVNDPAQMAGAVAETERAFGPIDVLVNNAGYVKLGAIEESTDADYRGMFDTNFFGPMQLARLVVPGMRQRRRGSIINVSSVGGFNPRPGASAYSAAKAALDAASESLSIEVAPFGVEVTVIILGAFRTQVMESMTYADRKIDAYADTAHATQADFARRSGRQPGDTRKAAAVIVDMVKRGQAPLRLPLGPGSVDRVRLKLAAIAKDLDAGAAQAAAVNYDEA